MFLLVAYPPCNFDLLCVEICAAAKIGDVVLLNTLLQKHRDVNINAPSPEWPDWTPMHLAIENKHWGAVHALLAAGVC